jgi:heme-degrading monooxygenase HmoA
MFAVIARFPAAPAHKDEFLSNLDESIAVTRTQPGFLAYQVLEPSQSADTRVCLMLWESKESFQTFLKSDASKEAHAKVRPEHFSETPTIEELAVLETWHAPTAVV